MALSGRMTLSGTNIPLSDLDHLMLNSIYPTDFKMPYFAHASCVDYLLLFIAGVSFMCDAGAIKLSDINLLCQEWLNPHNYLGSRWSERRGVNALPDVNFNTLVAYH